MEIVSNLRFFQGFVMNRYLFLVSGVFATMFAVSPVYADNLMQVYSQALKSDPIYAQAVSTWHSEKMNFPIARAGYLPQLSLIGNAARQYQQTNPNFFPSFSGPSSTNSAGVFSVGNGTSWLYGYSLTATQQVFNYGVWEQMKNASYSVKAATATFLAAQQSLMQRTATAYFAVLKAYDQLRYTVANKRAVWEQFVTAREQFRVGLIAITDEYDARARYDQVVALELANLNNLNIQLENLRALTDHSYSSLNGLGKLPLLTPQPNNINTWVKISDKQNYSIQAQNFTVLANMENIKQQAAAAYPSIGLTGGVSEQHLTDASPNATEDTADLGLELAYNPIQGGLVDAKTKQARYNYVTASGLLEQTHRQVVDQARTSFLSILSDISRVKADRQTIMSTQNAFDATEAGLKVGTRTMVDVLNSLTSVYQAQQQYANDQYSYISDLINLKLAAGTLSERDLAEINSWLGKPIRFPSQMSVATVPAENSHEELGIDTGPNISKAYTEDNKQKTVSSDDAVTQPATTQSTTMQPATTQPAVVPPAPTSISTPTTPLIPVPKSSPNLTLIPAPGSTYTPIPAPASTSQRSHPVG